MGFLWSLALSIQFLLLYSLFSSTVTNCFPSIRPTHECHEDERNALLQFKESFVISKFASYSPFSYPKTASWMPGTDCCSWDGIECDELTVHVISIDLSSSQLYGSMDANSSLFSLVHLQRLDLSDNDFNHSRIPARIGEFSQLRYLNLSQFSETTFSGEIPPEVSQLSNLLSLDLRSYTGFFIRDPINHLRLKISTLRGLIQNSTRLKDLRLSCVTISSSVPDILTNLTYLQNLFLSHCDLYGEFPVGIFHLPNLRMLVLGYNQNLWGMLPDFHSKALISILYLPGTSFYGTLPASIGNLSSLNWLSISECNFYGSIPFTLGNLNQLVYLDLGQNGFTIWTLPLSFANLTQLSSLSLGRSNLGGEIPSWIMNLTNLAYLDLQDNILDGEVPHSLFRLENLASCSLRYNFFEGQLELDMFMKLKMLNALDLSYNKLSLLNRRSSTNVTLPPIQWLGLASCNLSGEIPSWIMNLTTLNYLNLERNKLQGEIPHFLFLLENLAILDLNDNWLEGRIELNMLSKLKMLTFLGLGGNKLSFLEGKSSSNVTFSQIQVLELASCNLVVFPNFIQHLEELAVLYVADNGIKSIPSWMWNKRYLVDLVVSNNALIGEISPLICDLKSLVRLDLSYNKLVGMIPSCLGSFGQSLQILTLRGNKLAGHIPQTYMIGNVLKVIDFGYNNLHGQLPRALVNCRMLELLDVSHNHINDSFPFWLGSLVELKVIALNDNEFYGAIKCPWKCTFPKLHIIDLSHNDFSGNLPSEIIKNCKSMTASNISQSHFKDIIDSGRNNIGGVDLLSFSFTMSNKGTVMNYKGLQYFHYMVAIDLSCNKISGEIPYIMGSLKDLVSLNLSNNMLTGSIPSSLGKLSNLEVLDLSFNSLTGKIPQQLTELTFLSFFNVSYNNLSGPIPENNQFSTFEDNSFEGNQGLCGIQLLQKCEDRARPPPPEFDSDQDSDAGPFFEFDWKIILIGYVGGLVIGVALESAFSSNIHGWAKRVFKSKPRLWTSEV